MQPAPLMQTPPKRIVKVKGKGDKERIVILGDRAILSLKSHINKNNIRHFYLYPSLLSKSKAKYTLLYYLDLKGFLL